MAERRRPHARTLAVLRVLLWPYRYPPLSWHVRFIDWVVTDRRRQVGLIMVCVAVCAVAVLTHV